MSPFSDDKFSMPPAEISTMQLYLLLQKIDTKQSLQLIKQEEMEEELEALKLENAEMRRTWETAANVLAFIKYLAAISAAVTVIYVSWGSALEKVREWALK